MSLRVPWILGVLSVLTTVQSVRAIDLRPGDVIAALPDGFGGDCFDLHGCGALVRVDPVTGNQTVISQGGFFTDPVSVIWGPDGSLLVRDEALSHGSPALIRVEPGTGEQVLWPLEEGPCCVLRDMERLESGVLLMMEGSNCFAFDPSGAFLGFCLGFTTFQVETSGTYLTNYAGVLARVAYPFNSGLDYQTISSGGYLDQYWYALTIDQHGNAIIAVDGGLVRVNVVTGEQTVLALFPSGCNVVVPSSLAVEPSGTILYVDSCYYPSLSRVDPETGLVSFHFAQLANAVHDGIWPEGFVVVPSQEPTSPACSDGFDNDSDGFTDYPLTPPVRLQAPTGSPRDVRMASTATGIRSSTSTEERLAMAGFRELLQIRSALASHSRTPKPGRHVDWVPRSACCCCSTSRGSAYTWAPPLPSSSSRAAGPPQDRAGGALRALLAAGRRATGRR